MQAIAHLTLQLCDMTMCFNTTLPFSCISTVHSTSSLLATKLGFLTSFWYRYITYTGYIILYTEMSFFYKVCVCFSLSLWNLDWPCCQSNWNSFESFQKTFHKMTCLQHRQQTVPCRRTNGETTFHTVHSGAWDREIIIIPHLLIILPSPSSSVDFYIHWTNCWFNTDSLNSATLGHCLLTT